MDDTRNESIEETGGFPHDVHDAPRPSDAVYDDHGLRDPQTLPPAQRNLLDLYRQHDEANKARLQDLVAINTLRERAQMIRFDTARMHTWPWQRQKKAMIAGLEHQATWLDEEADRAANRVENQARNFEELRQKIGDAHGLAEAVRDRSALGHADGDPHLEQAHAQYSSIEEADLIQVERARRNGQELEL